MTDIVELLREEVLNPAQYWEAQASMWHANYKEASHKADRLHEALSDLVNLHSQHREEWNEAIAKARDALGENE